MSAPTAAEPGQYTLLDEVLTDSVIRATGLAHARPRDGQLELTHAIHDAIVEPGSSTIGAAPTGLGKSLSYLVPSALLFATTGARTVISTESLALQAQVLEKDAPVVVAAVKAATGVHVNVEVLKGWSNWTCLRSTLTTAANLLGHQYHHGTHVPNDVELDDLLGGIEDLLGSQDPVTLDGRSYPAGQVAAITHWALSQHIGAAGAKAPGDKHSYSGESGEGLWNLVSVTPNECVGADTCPLATALCKPAAAKLRAAAADVIVTNHSMLATQAAKGIGVVVGSPRLGRFDAIVVDEAHALPAQVRNQGACEISGRRLRGAVRAVKSVLDDSASVVRSLIDDGESIAEALDAELAERMRSASAKETVVKLTEGDDPLYATGPLLEQWVSRAQLMVTRVAQGASGDMEVKIRRVRARFDGLKSDLDTVTEHRSGVARWVETSEYNGSTGYSARSTPVDVGGLLAANLWTAPLPAEERDAALEAAESAVQEEATSLGLSGEDLDLAREQQLSGIDTEKYRLSVVAVSATLPRGFGAQIAIPSPMVPYESPFEVAYAASMLFIPRAIDEASIRALKTDWSSMQRPKFNTAGHREWAGAIAVDLVEANGGSTLMLSATAESGRAYAARLRAAARGRWAVYSQWDGPPLRSLVAAWKEDVTSVMVGTRSMMTGVDAPGPTNSLVIVDRVPRGAGNPVDDARVEALASRMEIDRWAADRLVYVTDAALLLEQAAGRLVRSMSDSGMVAILDPRMLKFAPWAYNEQSRRVYQNAVSHFGAKTSEIEKAVSFLRRQSAAHIASAT